MGQVVKTTEPEGALSAIANQEQVVLTRAEKRIGNWGIRLGGGQCSYDLQVRENQDAHVLPCLNNQESLIRRKHHARHVPRRQLPKLWPRARFKLQVNYCL